MGIQINNEKNSTQTSQIAHKIFIQKKNYTHLKWSSTESTIFFLATLIQTFSPARDILEAKSRKSQALLILPTLSVLATEDNATLTNIYQGALLFPHRDTISWRLKGYPAIITKGNKLVRLH